MTKIRWVITLLVFLFAGNLSAQIHVSSAQTAAALASTLAGHGVTILNPSLTCRSWANGTFSLVSGAFALDSGVVLTNGRAASVPGIPGIDGPSTKLASNSNNTPGDAALSQLAGQSTMDACVLEFDVIPQGDTIKFSYIFSSEEYISAVCGKYNDVFGFFISGPGITGKENMALVPGTIIPVTINSINNGVPSSSGSLNRCTQMGPGSPFTSYYKDNSNGPILTHQGLTTTLEAVHHVNRCGVYHLKLAIADAGNDIYDSGVFLKAGSLESETFNVAAIPPIPKDTTALCIKGCLPGKFVIRRSKPGGQPQTIKFIAGGSAVAGYDYSAIPDSIVIPPYASSADLVINGLPTPLNGPKTIQLLLLTPGSCFGLNNIIDSARLVIYDSLHITLSNPDKPICVGDSVLLHVYGDSFLSYQWSPSSGISNPVAQSPWAFPGQDQIYHLTASIPGTLCPVKNLDAVVNTRVTPRLILSTNISQCYNTALRFDAATTDSNLFYSYKWSGPGGFASTVLNPMIAHLSQHNHGVYTITATNDTNGCKNVRLVNLTVNTPETPTVEAPIIFCRQDLLKDLPVQGTHLLWYTSPGDTLPRLIPDYSTDQVTDYQFFVSQTLDGCESPRTPVDILIKQCCDGTIAIPNAFTPNGDGTNDKFRPLMDYGYFITGMRIVNRWGQLVYAGFDAWDGYLDGVPAEAGTYFYRITFGCIRGGREERVGDVLLIK